MSAKDREVELLEAEVERLEAERDAAIASRDAALRLRDELRSYVRRAGRLTVECAALESFPIEMGGAGGYYVWRRGERNGPFVTLDAARVFVRLAAGLGPDPAGGGGA